MTTTISKIKLHFLPNRPTAIHPKLLTCNPTGLHDSQVQYWEPAKWVAKLRDYNKSDSTILLNTNMETGHSGASGRFEALREIAMEYAFLIGLEKDLF